MRAAKRVNYRVWSTPLQAEHRTQALPTPTPGVAIWWTDLAHPRSEIDRIAPWLSPAETERAARFGTEALRERYIAGRATLRFLLGRALGMPPELVPLRRGERGRPELYGSTAMPDFNVSHTDGGAVIAIAGGLPPGVRIGVDVEREDRQLGADRLARKFLTAREQATLPEQDAHERRRRFLRYWTCKEAMSKATGDGLAAPFGELTVALGTALELVEGSEPYAPAAWRLHAIAVPAGYFATLAIWDARGSLT
jgi:4'-phosphopantetheinyl transferase